jgi:hypothetical protein
MIANINNQTVGFIESASQYIARMRHLHDEADSLGFELFEGEKMDVILRALVQVKQNAPVAAPLMSRRPKERMIPGGPNLHDITLHDITLHDLTFHDIESEINDFDINT